MYHRGGRRTDLLFLLLHNTKDMELNTAQLFFRNKKWHLDIALLVACVRKKPFMRHMLALINYFLLKRRIISNV